MAEDDELGDLAEVKQSLEARPKKKISFRASVKKFSPFLRARSVSATKLKELKKIVVQTCKVYSFLFGLSLRTQNYL